MTSEIKVLTWDRRNDVAGIHFYFRQCIISIMPIVLIFLGDTMYVDILRHILMPYVVECIQCNNTYPSNNISADILVNVKFV